MIGQSLVPALLLAEKAWRWWFAEFLSFLPRAYLKRLGSSRLTLLVRPGDAATEIAIMASDRCLRQEAIGHPDASGEALSRLREIIDAATRGKSFDVIGIIPASQSLARMLTLPPAAKAHLEEAVRYQIERISPFKADNTLYDIKQLESDRAANELRLKLTILSKDSAAELDARSGNLGLRIDHFAVEAADGALETLAFKSQSDSRAKVAFGAKALLATASIFAASLLLVPILSKWKGIEALEKEVSVFKPKADQVLKLRSERENIIALRAQVIGLKKAALAPIAVLSRLSELLDDQTFLVDMRMERTVVTMSGLSSDASKLAQRLGAIEAFKSVKFSGPVLRDPQSARDRFTLILEMAPPS
jgi:general secretion pathway protein L